MFHRVRSEVQETNSSQQSQQSHAPRSSGYARPAYQQQESAQQAASIELEEASTAQAQAADNTEDTTGQKSAQVEQKKPESGTKDKTQVQTQASRVPGVPNLDTPMFQTNGAFQRPGQTTTNVPRTPSYAGGYGSTPYMPPIAPDLPSAFSADRTLTIGKGINMSGEIEACDHLVVEGTVEAALKGAKVLDITQSGTFYGTVEIEEATIAGRFEGDLTVNGRLTIKASGAITGSVAYRELEVESGALVDGKMTPLKAAVDAKNVDKYRAGTEASAMAKAKEIVGKKEGREPANHESGSYQRSGQR